MQIDCYGFEATSQWFKRRTLDPYLIKRSEGITYLCSATNSIGLSPSLAGRHVVAVLPSVDDGTNNSGKVAKLVCGWFLVGHGKYLGRISSSHSKVLAMTYLEFVCDLPRPFP